MIEIENLQKYFVEDKIFVTEHAAERFRQRGIRISDIRNAVNFGEIMNCLACKNGTMTDSFETYFAKLKTGYAIIKNVPCKKCEQCGEILFSASVIEKIEILIENVEKISSKIFIFDYKKAA